MASSDKVAAATELLGLWPYIALLSSYYSTEQIKMEHLCHKIPILCNIPLWCHSSSFTLYFTSVIDYTVHT